MLDSATIEPPCPLSIIAPRRGAHDEPRAPEVDVEHPVPVVGFRVEQHRRVADAGTHRHDGGYAAAFDRRGDRSLDRVGIADIDHDVGGTLEVPDDRERARFSENRDTCAAPMPEAPPVTSATAPVNVTWILRSRPYEVAGPCAGLLVVGDDDLAPDHEVVHRSARYK